MASVGAVQNRKKGKMETGRADWAPVGFLFMTIECSQSVHSIVVPHKIARDKRGVSNKYSKT